MGPMAEPADLSTHPIHLGLGATATTQPRLDDDMSWYQDYAERTAGDGIEGRIVMMATFDASWDSWEVHPNGAEVVACTEGRITLRQEHADRATDSVTLTTGEYAINPPGTWHTADIADGETATCLFITAGAGTEHRPR